METKAPLDHHPRFRRLADYLAAKAAPGKLPGRQHIDPVELFDMLPYLILIDVIREGGGELRYRIRLMGTEVVALAGSDGTGKFVEDVLTDPEEGAKIITRYEEILRTREPQYWQGVLAVPGRKHMAYERIAFPLSRDGENVDMFILVFGHIGPAAVEGGRPPEPAGPA